jgi:hypothetical protein
MPMVNASPAAAVASKALRRSRFKALPAMRCGAPRIRDGIGENCLHPSQNDTDLAIRADFPRQAITVQTCPYREAIGASFPAKLQCKACGPNGDTRMHFGHG